MQSYCAAPHKRYLVDGGTGNEMPLQNLQKCLDQQGCLGERVGSTKQPLKLEAIIVTHPDIDHVGGVTKLLNDYSYSGELVITEAFKEKENVFLSNFFVAIKTLFDIKRKLPKLPSKGEIREYYPLQCYFPMTGILYSTKATECSQQEAEESKATNTVDTSDGKKARVDTSDGKKANESSILTTVNETDDGFDIMLTGDSNAKMIKTVLSEKIKSTSFKPHIKVFQVPHHGSKENSDYELYKSFTADVYLISAGGQYGHPSNEVLSAIVHACVDNEHTSKIVVTNSRGLKLIKKGTYSREKLVPGLNRWRNRVQVYHLDDLFNPRNTSPHVTITSDQLLQGSDVVSWSPKGYITKIKKCKEKLQNMEVEIKKKDSKARVVSCSGEIIMDTKVNKLKIVIAPVPEEPWIKVGTMKCINQIYVLKDSITDDYRSACFLELDEETRGSEPEVYWIYCYHDNYFDCKEYLHEFSTTGRHKLLKFTLKPQPSHTFRNIDKLY